MNADVLIYSLSGKGIYVSLDDNRNLKVTGELARISDAELASLKMLKSEIILLLDEYSHKIIRQNENILVSERLVQFPMTAFQKRQGRQMLLERSLSDMLIHLTVKISDRMAIDRLLEACQTVFLQEPLLGVKLRDFDFRAGFVRQFESSSDLIDFTFVNFKWSGAECNSVSIKEALRDVWKTPTFDTSPLVTVVLIEVDSGESLLGVGLHPLIGDFKSACELLTRILAIYSVASPGEYRKGSSKPLFGDYASLKYNLLRQGRAKALADYWVNFLSDLPMIEVQANKRSEQMTSPKKTVTFSFSPEFWKTVQKFSIKFGFKPIAILSSGIRALFQRYYGHNDLLIGTAIDGRDHPQMADMIGPLVNYFGIRNPIDTGISFKELVQKEGSVLANAVLHSQYPLDELISELGLKWSSDNCPLFPVLVTLFQANKFFSGDNSNNDFELFDLNQGFICCDIMFEFVVASGIELRILYNGDVYDENFVSGIPGHLDQFLETAIREPKRLLNDIDYLPDSEKSIILNDFNKFVSRDLDVSIVELFEEQARRRREEIAIVYKDRQLTYEQLNSLSNKFARYLIDNYGVMPEDLIGVMLERNEIVVVCILGVLKAGAVFVPIDPNYPKERIREIRSALSYKVVIDDAAFMSFQAISSRLSSANLRLACKPSNLAYVIYTSGTSGKPKGVMIEHRNVVSIFYSWREIYQLEHIEVTLLQIASFSFDVFVGDLCRSLLLGGKMVVCPDDARIDPKELYRLMYTHQVSILESTPSLLLMLFNYLMDEELDVSFLKVLIFGSEGLSANLFSRVKQYVGSGVRVINSYGITETTIDSTYFEGDVVDFKGFVPIGKPFPNSSVFIVDEYGMLCPVGIIGKMYIGGDGLARGYLGRPDLTREKFLPSFFRPGELIYDTGDMAKWLPDGNIEFVGRIDDQVKVRGYRIELAEIETILSERADLSHIVVCVKRINNTDILVVYYVSLVNVEVKDLREHLLGRLPEYMVPNYYISLPRIPLTPNGKIDKRSLPEPLPKNLVGHNQVNADTDIEKQLVTIWANLLALDPIEISVTSNFFEIGGTSLSIIKMVNEVKAHVSSNVDLSPVKIFEYPSIRLLAQYLESGAGAEETGTDDDADSSLLALQETIRLLDS